ncbi:MAG TPA: hypothetical protein VFG54_22895 [Prolixibacteraceae bacterium]|nr:hypothetical protein [Prolixibacteraceae bacterium]
MHFRSSLLLPILILAMLWACQNPQKGNIKSDLELRNLRGNVKTITEINYTVSGKYQTTILFNENGFITEQATYNPDGSLIRKWVNEYDDQNRQLSRHCYVLDDSLSYILHYLYNGHGKLAFTHLHAPDGTLITKYATQYDDRQNVIKETALAEDATFKYLVLHTYDNQNKVAEEIYIDSVRNNTYKQIYGYNSESLINEISLKSPDDSLIKKTKYTYMADKKLDKAFNYNARGELISVKSYTYDKLSNVVEIMELFSKDKTHSIHTFQYSYDHQGNWTFLSESVNHEPGKILTRDIGYYN